MKMASALQHQHLKPFFGKDAAAVTFNTWIKAWLLGVHLSLGHFCHRLQRSAPSQAPRCPAGQPAEGQVLRGHSVLNAGHSCGHHRTPLPVQHALPQLRVAPVGGLAAPQLHAVSQGRALQGRACNRLNIHLVAVNVDQALLMQTMPD